MITRPSRLIARTFVIAAVIALGATTSATAGPPGTWTQVTGPHANTHEVGLARTADGVLHVLWPSDQGNAGNALHSSIAPDAKSIGGPHTVFTYASGVNSRMALIAADGGLRAFFSGLVGVEGEPLQGPMATATSADGTSWTAPAVASNNTPTGRSPVYAASGIGAALGTANTPIFAWGDSAPGVAGYHVGTSPAGPDVRFSTECCVYAPNIGVDAITGEAVLAWQFLHNSGNGTAYQSISPAGARTVAPGAAAAETSTRTAISGRIGAAGVYLAYLFGDNQFLSVPAVVQVGGGGAKKLPSASGARMIGLAPAPEGKMWFSWMRKNVLYATRSNKDVTKFGAVVKVKPPAGTSAIYRLAGEGSGGWLDMLALAEVSSAINNWHQRVLPGLSLSGKKGTGKVTVTVTDAGDAIKGAKVKIGKLSKTTNSKGKAVFKLKKGKYKAKASKSGYTSASKTVKAG